ncbi:hypothetical protein [Rubinisphaera sp. JC750]|uniref:hypothetical protein n=1 Tax=Rubinisphaera sp. JC750 TaxID=2898658 RepID=UPI001F360789|nr:hypothetical protein [Rubinisphaera sp. JC750]
MIDLWDVAGALFWVLILLLPFLIFESGFGKTFVLVVGLFVAAILFAQWGEQ